MWGLVNICLGCLHLLFPPICDVISLKQLCMSYNHGEGDYGRCDDKDNCTRLHICEGYIQGTCDSGDCGRSHDFFEPHPMRTLRGRGVPSGMVGSMLSVYRNILVLRGTLKSNAGAKNRSGRRGKRGGATTSSGVAKDESSPARPGNCFDLTPDFVTHRLKAIYCYCKQDIFDV